MTTEYTNNFRFNLPDFRMGPWHDLVNTNTVRIDQLLMSIYQGVDTSPWQNNYLYTLGTTAIDSADDSFWMCSTTHTSAPLPTTFAEDRVANPTYWNRVVVGVAPRGAWDNNIHYLVNDMVSDASQGVIAICITEHTSSPEPASIRDDEVYWTFIMDMSGTDAITADMVAYDDSTGFSGAIDVDQALDWVISVSHTNQLAIADIGPMTTDHETRIDTLEGEMNIAQAALIDHDTRIATNEAAITNLDNRVDAVEASDASQEGRLTTIEADIDALEIESATHLTEAPIDTKIYGRKDAAWAEVISGGGGGASVTISDTPPVGPSSGNLWWESDTGKLYIYYFDGTSAQWVLAFPSSLTTPAVKKNYIVNGAMQVSQEWGTTPGAGSFYPVDEFRGSNSSGGVLGAAQVVVATPGGSTHRVRFTCNTADVAIAAADFVGITHTIEGLRCADLLMGTASAKTFTLRFGVKAPAGTYGVLFRNAANNRHYVAECVIAAGEANTDVVKSITVPGDIIGTWAKDNTIGLMIWWVLMSGTDYHGTAGAWVGSALPYTTASQVNFMASNTNVFELFDVGLYEGTTAPTYVVPDYATELSLCQRYYERSVEHGGVYNALTGTRTVPYSNSNSVDSCSFMTNKRAAPAVQIYSPITGAVGKMYHNGIGDINVTADAISTMSFRIYPAVAVSTNCYYHFTASARQ